MKSSGSRDDARCNPRFTEYAPGSRFMRGTRQTTSSNSPAPRLHVAPATSRLLIPQSLVPIASAMATAAMMFSTGCRARTRSFTANPSPIGIPPAVSPVPFSIRAASTHAAAPAGTVSGPRRYSDPRFAPQASM